MLSGSVSVPKSSNKVTTISYPKNCNMDNCILIANGLKITEDKGYNYVGFFNDSMDLLNSAYYRSINLAKDGIILNVKNPTTGGAQTVHYKIFLLKIL